MPTDLVGLNLLPFCSAHSQRLQDCHGRALASVYSTGAKLRSLILPNLLMQAIFTARTCSGEAHAEENKTVPAHDIHGAFFTFCIHVINQPKIGLAEIIGFQQVLNGIRNMLASV